MPDKLECHECFQPKLYYYTAAKAISALHSASTGAQKITCQLINGIAGMAIVFIACFFIGGSIPGHYWIKIFTFALLALNPALIAINSQATNDTFVFLFSTIAFYALLKFLKKETLYLYLLLVAATIAAALSKPTGLPLFFVVVAAVSLHGIANILKSMASCDLFTALTNRRAIKRHVQIAVFIVLFLATVPPLGSYSYKGKYFDTTITIPKSEQPHLFKETFISNEYPERPGVTSLVHAFATFRFFDLLKHPVIEWWKFDFPRHRTSLWTQLYARTHFIQFDLWPISWKMNNWYVILLGRVIFILAILPTLIFAVGLFVYGSRFASACANKKFMEYWAGCDGIYPMGAAAYFLFVIMFCYTYRDYSSMKAIYVFPALLCFIQIFLEGMLYFYARWRKRFLMAIAPFFLCLLTLYVVDVLLLIKHLYDRLPANG